MPDPTLKAAIKEAYASAPAGQVIMHTMELRHPAFDDGNGNNVPIRVVRNYRDQDTWIGLGGASVTAVLDAMTADARDLVGFVGCLESTAPMNPSAYVAFTALAFDFDQPSVDGGGVPEMSVTMDNVGKEITDQLDLAATSQLKIEVTYRAFLSTDITGPQNNPPLTLTLSDVTADLQRIRGRARMLDVGNKSFPSILYTAKRFAALTR